MRVIGIDCGSKITGYGIVEGRPGQPPRRVASGTLETSRKDGFPQRLHSLYRQLKKIIARFSPEEVAIEALFYARNFRSALQLGSVRAVALLVAAGAGLPVAEYTALEVKSSVAGYGRAEKFQVQQMVKRLLSLPSSPLPHDEADALAVALCHLQMAASHAKIAMCGTAGAGVSRRKQATRPWHG